MSRRALTEPVPKVAMRSNCLLFAVALYWRRSGRERYILIRKSRLGSWLPHILYAERRPYGLRIVHFVPIDGKSKKVPPPFFRGFRRWGDPL